MEKPTLSFVGEKHCTEHPLSIEFDIIKWNFFWTFLPEHYCTGDAQSHRLYF